jgi:hypothetical protein
MSANTVTFPAGGAALQSPMTNTPTEERPRALRQRPRLLAAKVCHVHRFRCKHGMQQLLGSKKGSDAHIRIFRHLALSPHLCPARLRFRSRHAPPLRNSTPQPFLSPHHVSPILRAPRSRITACLSAVQMRAQGFTFCVWGAKAPCANSWQCAPPRAGHGRRRS